MNRINGKTKVLGVIGCPVEHTLSPSMHNAAINRLGLNYAYLPFLVKPRGLKGAIEGMKGLGISGLNVTIPHKENVIKYLDKTDNLAKKIGAVNTIVIGKGGLLTGYNTDAIGYAKSLEGHFNPKGRNIFLYGAGGVARAIAFTLLEEGVKALFITDIFNSKAKELSRKLGNKCAQVPFDSNSINETMKNTDMFVNASSAGMKENDPCQVNPGSMHKGLFVYDVIYNRETELIKNAKRRSLKYLDGADMFVHQGAVAFQYWTGKKAPLDVMYKIIREEVKRK